jgi:hypothetical protein
MGWEALALWSEDVARVESLAGGVANDGWSVRVNGQLAVGRLATGSDADRVWETELRLSDREGLTAPVPIPTTDGRLFADGLVVMTYLEGGPPETPEDWRRVAGTLRDLHRLTRGRLQGGHGSGSRLRRLMRRPLPLLTTQMHLRRLPGRCSAGHHLCAPAGPLHHRSLQETLFEDLDQRMAGLPPPDRDRLRGVASVVTARYDEVQRK